MSQRISTHLLLVRHGQTEWNADGRWQGHADPPLSAIGLEQAQRLARILLDDLPEGLNRFIASDLRRAHQTAEIVARGWGRTVQTDRRLRELDVGEWSGLKREEIVSRDRQTLEDFESGEPTIRPGGGESRLGIRFRAREFVEDMVRRHAGERILVVTHLGVIRALFPGAEPGNADRLDLVAEDWLRERADAGGATDPDQPGDSPL